MRKILTVTLVTASLASAFTAGTAAAATRRCAYDPNRVEYADDAKIAAKQHRSYCRYRLIGRNGAWTAKGRAWIDLRNGDVHSRKPAEVQLRRYRDLGLWNPNTIEYADSASRALKQFKTWFAKGYITSNGNWTDRS